MREWFEEWFFVKGKPRRVGRIAFDLKFLIFLCSERVDFVCGQRSCRTAKDVLASKKTLGKDVKAGHHDAS